MTYRFGETTYRIAVANPRGVNRGVQQVTLDGEPVPGGRVPLVDDGATHDVIVAMLGA
jgi:cellobiose phosphorylase